MRENEGACLSGNKEVRSLPRLRSYLHKRTLRFQMKSLIDKPTEFKAKLTQLNSKFQK